MVCHTPISKAEDNGNNQTSHVYTQNVEREMLAEGGSRCVSWEAILWGENSRPSNWLSAGVFWLFPCVTAQSMAEWGLSKLWGHGSVQCEETERYAGFPRCTVRARPCPPSARGGCLLYTQPSFCPAVVSSLLPITALWCPLTGTFLEHKDHVLSTVVLQPQVCNQNLVESATKYTTMMASSCKKSSTLEPRS